MREIKHTPGEWTLDHRQAGRVVIAGRPGFNGGCYRVADAYFSNSGLANTPRIEEAKANARLIAAAPDLLEAADWVWKVRGHPADMASAMLALKAAISKATGATP